MADNAKDLDSLTTAEKMAHMRQYGWPQTIPFTDRKILVRTVEPADLLRSGDCPDILAPLVYRSIHEDLSDKELREWLEQKADRKEDAIAYLDMLDLIAMKGIADDTAVSDLALGEKRWVFRFAMAPAYFLVYFRTTAQQDVAVVAQSEPVSPAAE